MLPGITSKLSEAEMACATTIVQATDVVHITDTTSTTVIATITPNFQGFSGLLILVNRSGNAITGTAAGNIGSTFSLADKKCMVFVYSKLAGKYYQEPN